MAKPESSHKHHFSRRSVADRMQNKSECWSIQLRTSIMVVHLVSEEWINEKNMYKSALIAQLQHAAHEIKVL
ncbi:hypothetical protein Mapa_017240 [Marchantia paleacea]|nr:hypothetical protein Mapa_017240 [Marchantia paleacea]